MSLTFRHPRLPLRLVEYASHLDTEPLAGREARPDRFRDLGWSRNPFVAGLGGFVTGLGHETFRGLRARLGRGGELDDRLRRGELEFGEDVAVGFGQLGASAGHSGGSGEGAHVQALELTADGRPGLAGG